jgi:hypothetical protein
VLDSHRPVHRLAEAITAKVLDEARPLVPDRLLGSLGWDEFAVAWWRAVRWVVLGDAARNDHELTDLLARLRPTVWAATAAYWAPLQIRLSLQSDSCGSATSGSVGLAGARDLMLGAIC